MGKDTNEQEETITMSKTDYDKAIQSAEDKLRTTYSLKIKDLESKLPKDETDEEKNYKQRLAALEQKEKRIAMQESLAKNKLDNSLADYLKDDADIDSFNTTIDTLVKQRITDAGFKPTGHTNNTEISKDQWHKMTYSQKQDFYNQNPELAKKFMGK